MNHDFLLYRGVIRPIRDCTPGDAFTYAVTQENSGFIVWRETTDSDGESAYPEFIAFERSKPAAIEKAVMLTVEARRDIRRAAA